MEMAVIIMRIARALLFQVLSIILFFVRPKCGITAGRGFLGLGRQHTGLRRMVLGKGARRGVRAPWGFQLCLVRLWRRDYKSGRAAIQVWAY